MIYLAIGRRERGKSTLAYSFARKVAQRIIVDPRRQFGATLRVGTVEDTEYAIEQMYADPTLDEIVVTPTGAIQPVFDAATETVQRWIDANPQRPLALVVDEARFYDLQTESFQWILRCAPRDVVHVLLTAHRPKDDEIPVSIQSIADHWLIFHTTQSHDLKVLRERAGDDVAARVEKLSAYEWVQWDDGRGVATVHSDPAAWYVPIHGDAVAVARRERLTPTSRAITRRLFDA